MTVSKYPKELHVYETGSESSPAILFLHGSPLSGRMWLPQLERLPEFHVLAPDLPEHGQSADIRPFTMEDTVARLVALIRRSTPDGRAHVVGLSFGGVVAQALMVQAPDVVDHVILSGTSARMGRALQAALRAQVCLSKPLLARLRPQHLGALVAAQFGIPAAYRSMLGEEMQRVPPEALARLLVASYAEIVTPAAPSSPVLVVVGQRETPVAKAMARRLCRTMAGAQGVMVPGAGHVWNLQFPDLCAEAVRAWVTDQPLPAALLPL
jgi:pimeloyl-ACP methyl ester carboxylesterase